MSDLLSLNKKEGAIKYTDFNRSFFFIGYRYFGVYDTRLCR